MCLTHTGVETSTSDERTSELERRTRRLQVELLETREDIETFLSIVLHVYVDPLWQRISALEREVAELRGEELPPSSQLEEVIRSGVSDALRRHSKRVASLMRIKPR